MYKRQTPTQGVFGAGTGTLPNTTSAGTLNIYWWRGIGSDTATTPGTLASNYWSTPTVFENVSYYSDADSTPDSGADDQYWHTFNFTTGSFGNPLQMNGGGLLKIRRIASNTAPTGSVKNDFDTASPAPTYYTLQNNVTDLGDPQGRLLKLEWRHEPGSDWPLNCGSSHVFVTTPTVGLLTHQATPLNAQPATLPVADAGASGGTLPFDPEIPVGVNFTPRKSTTRMEYPYTVHRAMGTVIRRSYQVTWLLNSTELSTLTAFFSARDGGEQAFTWTAPGDDVTSKAALLGNLDIAKLAPDAFEIKANLMEVF